MTALPSLAASCIISTGLPAAASKAGAGHDPCERSSVTTTPEIPAELLTLLAHDLRNPVSALLANLHYLRGTPHDAARSGDALDAIDDAISLCSVLERLISNLDVIAHGDGNRSSRMAVPIRQLGAEMVLRQREFAEAVGLELELEALVGDDVLIVVDGELLMRAASNLIANAIEHAPPRSRIAVEVEQRGSEAAITILDKGPAIPLPLRHAALSALEHCAGRAAPNSRFGRGLGLLAADVAARASGARLEIDGDEQGSRLRLVASIGE